MGLAVPELLELGAASFAHFAGGSARCQGAGRGRAGEVLGRGLSVSVTNTGDVALRVMAVYVNESLAWSGALDLAPGANSLLTVNAPCGSRYLVKACSARGNCWSFLEEEAWGG